jgi:hypothetical protein
MEFLYLPINAKTLHRLSAFSSHDVIQYYRLHTSLRAFPSCFPFKFAIPFSPRSTSPPHHRDAPSQHIHNSTHHRLPSTPLSSRTFAWDRSHKHSHTRENACWWEIDLVKSEREVSDARCADSVHLSAYHTQELMMNVAKAVLGDASYIPTVPMHLLLYRFVRSTPQHLSCLAGPFTRRPYRAYSTSQQHRKHSL